MMELTSWRILHIDDDEDDYFIVREMLRAAQGRNIILDWANSYAAGLQMLDSGVYQAVLIDYDLRQSTGIQLIREFVGRGYTTPMILLTGRGSVEVDVEAMQAGATLYLTKTEINPTLLERSIRYAIERKQTEERLRISEHKFSIVFDRSPTPIFLITLSDLRYVDVNQAYLDLVDFSREEIIGRTSLELGINRDSEEGQRWRDAFKGQSRLNSIETYRYTRSGARRMISMNLEILEIEGQQHILGVVEDITDRREAERALKEREQAEKEIRDRFQAVLENSMDAAYRRDLKKERFDYISPAITDVVGLSVDEIMRMSPQDILSRIHSDDLTAVETGLTDAARLGKGRLEYRFKGKDGQYRWLADYITVSRDPEGNLSYRTGNIRDVTEDRHFEEELRDTNSRLRAFVDANIVGVVLVEKSGRILEANQYILDMLGFSVEEMEAGKLDWRVLTPPEYLRLDERAIQEMEQCGVCVPYEKELFRKDGSRVWILLSDAILPSGEITACGVDITARKIAERALKEGEERYRLAVRAINEAIWDWNLKTGIITWNETLSELFGYKLADNQETTTRWWQERIHPEDYDRVLNSLHNFLEGQEEVWTEDYRFLRADGFYAEINDRGWVVRASEGQPVRMVGGMRDITRQRAAERTLSENEARFRQLADSMPQLVWMARPDGSVEYYNLRREEYNGFSLVDGKNWEWSPVLHPEDVQKTVDAWDQAVRTQTVYQTEHRVCMADGTYRWHLSRGIPAFNERGKLMKWYGTATDIHDFKKAQAALVDYAEKLNRSNEELENFALIASHDMQEPLRKILTFGNLLRQELDVEFSPTAGDYLARMLDASQRMQAMINGLLDLSRVSTMGREFENVDIHQIAEGVISDLDLRLKETSGQVLLSELPWVRGDFLQLRQLLQNIIGNGLKYHREGVSPVVKISGKQVVDGEGRHLVQISIEDNGIGFEMDQAEKIFRPFVRLHGRGKFEGSGIGLAICRRIVERHGGSLIAAGQPGVGSQFTLTLPTAEDSSGGI